ncbi:granulin a isoform X2 [Kryptolebias marmoratus]|uniref:granulin a isoform X2 n=1 Tax=Kryptolebias marmoratus TaxID=37003 RepID=UPI0007F8D0C6|nr:granulin a isoform X2 [Kryptolebias marmoratus]
MLFLTKNYKFKKSYKIMQSWVVICGALLVLVGADECPDAGRCKEGQTCCNSPSNGYECCPFDQAECCEDHVHCCPAGTLCDGATSSCVNNTVSIPWVERASAEQPPVSKSFRMIKSYMGEDDDNVCPDQSRCPAEFSCLKALTRFGCCPLAKGVSCSDGKHCCPEGHQCSLDSHSCIIKVVTTVLCNDGLSECPNGASCSETPEGNWGCCPIPKAVCCDDKLHCCSEGTTCDVEHMKCISASEGESPMWDKFPARLSADWENQKEGGRIISKTADNTETEKSPEVTTISSVPSFDKEVSHQAVTVGNIPCTETVSCPDGSTCCKTKHGSWACCPLLQAVCCDDGEHCCPAETTCDLTTLTCVNASDSMPTTEKIPAFTSETPPTEGVTAPNQVTTTAEMAEEEVPTPQAAEEEEDDEEEEDEVGDRIQCDAHTSCPSETTCCFMASCKKWGCCPLPKAVCCADGSHCCPTGYQCEDSRVSCVKDGVVIPWYTKIPATTSSSSDPRSVQCDAVNKCPEHTSCCRLFTGEWGCCPLQNAVCCPDQKHCCPQGYTCDITSRSCQKVIMLQLETIPLIPVYLPEYHLQLAPLKHRDIQCDDRYKCKDSETCCRTSAMTWGCCPAPNAVCCSDMKHCCPADYSCTEGGACIQNTRPNWHNWNFLNNKKRALNL